MVGPAFRRRVGLGLLLAGAILPPAALAQEPGLRLTPAQQATLTSEARRAAQGILGLMAYSAVPDATASSLSISRSNTDTTSLTMWQTGLGFTVSEELPLYVEGYMGLSRFDPRFVVSDGTSNRTVPTKWNILSGTLGLGWDIRLTETLKLRPIAMGSLGILTSDSQLGGQVLDWATGQDVPLFDRGSAVASGIGGALALAYSSWNEDREIDVELRWTRMRIEGVGRVSDRSIGQVDAEAVALWSRLRWPTGSEAFGRPVRWVLEGAHSVFLQDQGKALGFDQLTRVGWGLELDVGGEGYGALGFAAQRLRWMMRGVYGNDVWGVSTGIAISIW
jgi:hypothetical protein